MILRSRAAFFLMRTTDPRYHDNGWCKLFYCVEELEKMSRKDLDALGSQRESLSNNPLLIQVCSDPLISRQAGKLLVFLMFSV